MVVVVAEGWREQALRSITEGLCPNGHGPLDENSFCMHCSRIGVHYLIKNGDTVVCLYPGHPGEPGEEMKDIYLLVKAVVPEDTQPAKVRDVALEMLNVLASNGARDWMWDAAISERPGITS